MTAPSRPPLQPSGYQRVVATLFLVVATLMVTQYAVVKFGPALVFITPLALSQPDDFAYDAAEQAPGVFVINWDVLDRCFYKLQAGTFLPPAEGLTALLFLVALPLLAVQGWRRQVWPRAPLVLLALVGLVSCLAAEHFKAAVRENAQIILTTLLTCWLAATAVGEPEQAKRLGRWLATLTVVLLLWASYDYWRQVQTASPAVPVAVRASCSSRSAFSGLLVMLLPLLFARWLVGRNPLTRVFWLAVWTLGCTRLLNGGAVLAVGFGAVAMAFVRGRGAGLFNLLLVPPLLWAACTFSHAGHDRLLLESVGFYRTAADGTPTGVEKRYLEMAATLTGLRSKQDVIDKTETSDSAALLGRRSNVAMGVGAGLNYQRSIGGYYGNLDNPEKQEQDSYNLYLLLALQMGFFAALLWAWILTDGAAVARAAHDQSSDDELRILALGIYGACLGLVVFSVFGTVLVRGLALLLFSLLGVASRLEWWTRPEQAEPPRQRATEPAATAPATLVAAVAADAADEDSEPADEPVADPAPAAEAVVEEPAPEPEPAASRPTGELDIDADGLGSGPPPDDLGVAQTDVRAWLQEQGLLDPDAAGSDPEPEPPPREP
ncbi:MAG: hypothetical protein IT204_09995 [Fimbriimonadaceae bacterium]|nr:hypothetical protein [Fimbriimonadaceae bacterium]